MDQLLVQIQRRKYALLSMMMFIIGWCLYGLTTAPGTIYGDPSEYQFIPALWGIAHPPGYAFYTLLAGLWQRLLPIGTIAFRTNLLAGAAAAWSISRVVLILSSVLTKIPDIKSTTITLVTLLSSTAFAISPDVWQHAIHANAHIVSLAITSTQLWLLVEWSEKKNNNWLFTFAFFCGIGVTHHPITIWGLPAYAIYILVKQPKIIKNPNQIILFILSGLLGLAPLLYYVFRSPNVPFGPTDMRTWSGFIRHATAQGLRVNLFHYGLSDQFERWSVFISLLRLQYAIPFLLCLIPGFYIILKYRIPEGLLIFLFLLGHLAFTLNSVQDVMAYMLHVFMAIVFPIAFGFAFVLKWWYQRSTKLGYILTVSALVLLTGMQLVTRFPLVSLRNWREADRTFMDLVEKFNGKGNNAAYVSDWEHLTPFYYHTLVEGMLFDSDDLRPVYVTSGLSWEKAVFANLPAGPVYLSNYRREIRDLGFRLRPAGELWQVLEPPAFDPVNPQYPLNNIELEEGIQILGYDLPTQEISPGGVIPLTLYSRSRFTQTDILMPYLSIGSEEQRWTTDSRRLTPDWLPNEIIVEQYNIYISHNMNANALPLKLGFANLSAGNAPILLNNGSEYIDLGEITILESKDISAKREILDRSLAIVGNDISLLSARVRNGLQRRAGVWEEPIVVKKIKALHLNLSWFTLKHPKMSYTVFIHLIDANGVPHFGHDYTPLGGAFPTYLWFPKWLPGQRVNDPYKLIIPSDVSPGTYWLEIGMYEMGSVRRIPLLDKTGSMTGDRLILGPVLIEPTD